MRVFTCIISALVFAVFAGLCGAACWFRYGLWAIAVWAAMIAAVPLSSLLHELGHMLFGAMCGVKAKPHFSLLGSSSCEIIPKKQTKLKARIIFTALGGVAVNLLVVLILNLLILFDAPAWLLFFAPANAYLLILNAMPAYLNSGKTDGYVIDGFINNTDESKVMLAVLYVQAGLLGGKAIEDTPENLLFGLPQIREDDGAFIALTELRYRYKQAKGEEEEALKYKQRFEELKKEYS